MKKKTRFKLKNDLVVPFRIAVLICLTGAAVNYLLFHNSFFKALSKLDEEPIATITFKYKNAERKFLDRVLWDRLKQESPVYNGDTIHTAENSEATVYFQDGTILELLENTMAQVFLHTSGFCEAKLEKGNASVDLSSSNSLFKFNNKKNELSVQNGSKIFVTKENEKDLQIFVQNGQAEFNDGIIISAGSNVTVTNDGEVFENPFTVTRPEPNRKFLYFVNGQCNIDFNWHFLDKKSPLKLLISEDKYFSNVIKTFSLDSEESLSVMLPKGVYYWRMESTENNGQDKNFSENGKFQVIQSLKPELIIPVKDYTYNYRKQLPSIRFIWTESEAATAYNFEISRNEDLSEPVITQRISGQSIIISTLDAGKYYYRVTPYYVLNKTGFANPSQINSFSIEQREKLAKPTLIIPSDKDFLNKTKKNPGLSWKMQNEQLTYKVMVSKNSDLTSPVYEKETQENYIVFSKDELNTLSDGEYYWAITQIDTEGNSSELSEIRSFYAITGEIEQRTLFPPDNYSVWKPLLTDTRFTWKSNLIMTQYIQIAKDEKFAEIVSENEINGQSLSGPDLPEGKYFWRITVKDSNHTLSSKTKSFAVVSELPAPKLIFPALGSKAVVRPNQPCTFKWEKADEVDYYRLKLYQKGSDEPIFDQNFITDDNYSVDVENFEEGEFRWELQGYSYENELNSRRSSKLSEEAFILRKIKPVKQVSPANGTVFSGWEAIETPPELKWKSTENFSEATIVLSKKSGISASQKSMKQKSFVQKLSSLSSGIYEWKINAISFDGFDISSQESYNFTVEEIPPFDAPKRAETEGGTVFNAEYLKKTPYIVFNWQSVPRAEAYILEIKGKNKKSIFQTVIKKNEGTTFKFENLTKLGKGTFTWNVKACRMNEKFTEILIDGKPAENSFVIDYNLNKNGGKRKTKGVLYAK